LDSCIHGAEESSESVIEKADYDQAFTQALQFIGTSRLPWLKVGELLHEMDEQRLVRYPFLLCVLIGEMRVDSNQCRLWVDLPPAGPALRKVKKVATSCESFRRMSHR
jgi:hypothetical protein